MSNNVWHYGCFSWFYFGWWYISSSSAYDSWIDISLALESFWKRIFYFWYAINLFTQCKSQSIYIWNRLAFISLFVYLYNMMLIVSYISSFYNRLRIVRRGWASLRFWREGCLWVIIKSLWLSLGFYQSWYPLEHLWRLFV